MQGTILTRQKCRQCDQPFGLGMFQGRVALVCACGHAANRHTILLKWKGQQLWISKDRDGRPLATYEHAVRELEGIRREIDRHAFNPALYRPSKLKPMLAENYFPRWLEHQKARADHGEIAPSTLRMRTRFVRYWAEAFRGKDIRDLRYGDFEDYKDELLKRRSPKTVWNIIRDLRACLRWAKRRGDLGAMPEFPEVKYDRTEVKWIDEATQFQIISEIPERHRPVYIFLATYGRRPGEARALKWDCIDFKNRDILIKRTFSDNTVKESTKAHIVTRLKMTPEIEAMLNALPRSISGYVFVNEQGRPYQHLERKWERAAKKVGVNITLYQGTRHSFGTQAVAEGHSLALVGQAMGHADPRTTMRYVASDSNRLVKVARRQIATLLQPGFKKLSD
ncbi:MAG: site-specific integrase [Proteobacteria bacterium]|nr:site-specific integrase [Pseudomonadota bacterium]MBU1742301.1 site-specific integrase [Pseudomonadota bacterium]